MSKDLTLNTLLGFLYIEYYGTVVLDHTTVYYLDDFYGKLLPVLEHYIVHGVSKVLEYDGLLFVVKNHADTHVWVVINAVSMNVPAKRFLRSVLFSIWSLFAKKSTIMYRLTKKYGCEKEIALIQLLLKKIDNLPE